MSERKPWCLARDEWPEFYLDPEVDDSMPYIPVSFNPNNHWDVYEREKFQEWEDEGGLKFATRAFNRELRSLKLAKRRMINPDYCNKSHRNYEKYLQKHPSD